MTATPHAVIAIRRIVHRLVRLMDSRDALEDAARFSSDAEEDATHDLAQARAALDRVQARLENRLVTLVRENPNVGAKAMVELVVWAKQDGGDGHSVP